VQCVSNGFAVKNLRAKVGMAGGTIPASSINKHDNMTQKLILNRL
jgi:hypothetical protein